LKEGATFFYGPIYPTSKEEDEEIQKYLKDNLANGFIRRSISPAAHPVLFQRKKNGELRLCIDYRKLNQQTLRNSYPLPLITVVFEAMRGSKIFSKLELKSAYNHNYLPNARLVGRNSYLLLTLPSSTDLVNRMVKLTNFP